VKSSVWTSHAFLIFILASLGIYITYAPVAENISNAGYDFAAHFLPEPVLSQSVAVIAIDQKAIDHFGLWPWPRSYIADAINHLQKIKVNAIGLMMPLDYVQTPGELKSFQEYIEQSDPSLNKKLANWLVKLDADHTLAQALSRSGNVILESKYSESSNQERSSSVALPQSLPDFQLPIGQFSRPRLFQPFFAPPVKQYTLESYPVDAFLHAAKGIGLNEKTFGSKTLRSLPLAVELDGKLLPGFALRLAAPSLGVRQDDIEYLPGYGIRLGSTRLPAAPGLLYRPKPSKFSTKESAIAVYSIADVLNGTVSSNSLKSKTILIGFTAPNLAPILQSSAGIQTYPVIWNGYGVASILDQNSITVPYWFYAGQRAAIVLFALYLLFLPRRFRGKPGFFIQLGISIFILNVGFLLLISRFIWLPVVVPSLFLVAAQIIVSARNRIALAVEQTREEATQAHFALANNLHAQGKFGLAFDEFLKCPANEPLLEPLYQLGLDFERRRHFTKALSVYEHIEKIKSDYRDLAQRQQRLKALPSMVSPAKANAGATLVATMVSNNPTCEKPVLGRYQLEAELGKGAMGVVYLGIDPKIGRKVAIKTLAFTEEFDESERDDITQRFFREAEAAGRLDHPNIVTIYDAGEEHDLAYIAMDYAPGENLDAYTHPEQCLSLKTVMDIAIQVAEALEFAHEKGVVHRDIKPSNIIYDETTNSVKITDFGIAFLIDDSRTRTGMILGSPSYMSPEQVAGKKVDGRSDLYSLAVTMYQLFSCKLPFTGDSLANLMYRIANDKPVSIKKVRSDVTPCITRIINKALHKDPAKRFQTSQAMAESLRKCRDKM
jgi:CHASE2 domain-containing sensor protein